MTPSAASSTTASAERMREVLLDLDQSQQRERQLRAQSDALLEGLRAFSEATSPDDLFARVLEALRQPVDFDAAFVLRPGSSREELVASNTTDPLFLGCRWTVGKSIKRMLASGRVAIHLDTSVVKEWQAMSSEIQDRVRSALFIPLRGSKETALLVCVQRETKAFQTPHEEIARRFQPLVTQALRDAERMAQIEVANREMRLLLDSVDQGFLTIDRGGNLVGECSAVVGRWFGGVEPDMPLASLFSRVDNKLGAEFAVAWEQVQDGFLPLALSLDVMPSRVRLGDKTLAIRLSPIGTEETWQRMLVIVSDISAALLRERAEERMREFAAVVTRITRDRQGFLSYSRDATELIAQLVAGGCQDKETQFRRLHTLKGNSSVMGIGSVARLAHRLEDKLAEGALEPSQFKALQERWAELSGELAPILSEITHDITVTEKEHEWLLKRLSIAAAGASVVSAVEGWRYPRVADMLQSTADDARSIAQQLGKGNVLISAEDDGLRLDPEIWRPFFSTWIHLIRNAIDHGIEESTQRETAGKSTPGRLVLRERRSEKGLVFEVEDDGRGIDWDAVAKRAKILGLPCATPAQLQQALFTDGLSTREQVSDISGRGVGVGAFKQAVEVLGGHVEVDTRFGVGTCIRAVFDRAS